MCTIKNSVVGGLIAKVAGQGPPSPATFPMSNLDQGLDAIIASGGGFSNGSSATAASKNRRNRSRPVKKAASASSTSSLGKAVASASKASRRNKAKRTANATANVAAAAFASATAKDPLATAKRVVVSGLPLDVDENAVRDFFKSSVGRIRNIKGAYNAHGGSTGSFTITFEKNGAAQTVLEKFNNQPIDGGKSRISVQILIDAAAAAAPPKSLAERIGAPAPAAGKAAGAQPTKKKQAQKGKQTKKGAAPVKAVKAAPAKKNNKSQKKKPAPRSAADLDAEMNDYFDSKEKNEISV